MARKKVSTTVYIEPEQADQLKVLHERTKVPVAVYIREGIELVLAKYQHVLPGQLTLEQQRRAAQQSGSSSSSSSSSSGGNAPNTPPANTGTGTGTGG
jgi:predicted DNA-binding protein